jgi:hypothetical protein
MSRKPTPVLAIQLPGADGRYERYYRIPVVDAKADTLRKAITAWARKPSAYEIGERRTEAHGFKKSKRAAPVFRPDHERAIPEMPGK